METTQSSQRGSQNGTAETQEISVKTRIDGIRFKAGSDPIMASFSLETEVTTGEGQIACSMHFRTERGKA